jgi:hypothetical protein
VKRLSFVLAISFTLVWGLQAQKPRAVPSVMQVNHVRIPLDGITVLAAAPDESVWFVPDFWETGIGRVTPAGEITRYDVPGGQFLTVDSDGAVWTDIGGGRLQRFKPGRPVDLFTTGAKSISGLALDAMGRPWFTDAAAHAVGYLEYSSGTSKEFALPDSLQTPGLISAGPGGQMWFVTSNGHIASVADDGVVHESSFPELQGKTIPAVAGTPDAFYVAIDCRECNHVECPYPRDHGLVARIEADHTMTIIADIGSNNIYSLAAGRDGAVYALKAAGNSSAWMFPGQLLAIRPSGAVDVFDTQAPANLPVTKGSLAITRTGALWGVHLGGGESPLIFRFSAALLR